MGFAKFVFMNHPPSIDRKSLKNPDAFVAKGTQLLGRFSRSKWGLWPILGLGLLLGVGFYGLDSWEEKKEQKAWGLYYQATQVAEPDKWVKYEAVYSAYSKNRAGMLAAVELADHFVEETTKAEKSASNSGKDYGAKAIEWYQKAQVFPGLLPVEKQLLLINQGNAEELIKNYSSSLSSYEKASLIKSPAKALALLGVGRSQEALGEKEKAGQTYEKIFMEFASTEYAKTAKMHWRKLKSPLFNSALNPGSDS